MEPRPLVLLCAASGTGLSKVTARLTETLAGDETSIVHDLETLLCEHYEGDSRIVRSSTQIPSMELVVRLPRDELHREWDRLCESLMQDFAKRTADLRVLSLHLTWYNSNTTEFYSPVNVKLLENKDCKVDRVIILIDDIYDMYCRLRGPNDLYGDNVIRNKAYLIAGLRGIDLYQPPESWTKEEVKQSKDRFRIEALELALGHLMSWRRSEMAYAENLARTLGADFTVLGTKHSLSSIGHLTRSLSMPKIYLSHRISDVRRMNKAESSLPDDPGEWSAIVGEVNRLHWDFADAGQLLINPTAIDELRFAGPAPDKPDASEEGTAEEQKPDQTPNEPRAYSGSEATLLAKRWTVPEPRSELMWVGEAKDSTGQPSELDPEHTKLLVGPLPPNDPVALSIARALEDRIFEEVSFRDHIIVENTPHLCVYRPFSHDRTAQPDAAVDWSGGVEPEIDHWRTKYGFAQMPSAKVALVHTRHEIMARIRWLRDNPEQIKDNVGSTMRRLFDKWGVSPEEKIGFFEGRIVKPSPTGLAQNPLVVLIRDSDVVLGWIQAATTVALTGAFTKLKLDEESTPPSDAPGAIAIPPERLGLFYLEEDEEGRARDLTAITQKLCMFFAEPPTGSTEAHQRRKMITASRTDFWDIHDKEFLRIIEQEPVEYVSHQLGYPYAELLKLAEGAPTEDDSANTTTYTVPIPSRHPGENTTPPRTREPANAEPRISDEDFASIIADIRRTLTSFERSPRHRASAPEQHLRDEILTALQPQGPATGESYSRRGRSDIYLPYDGEAVFLAECKWWRGRKAFAEGALPQLLDRYIIWRDTHAAMILFIRNKGATAVIDNAVDAIESHPRFVSESEPIGDVRTFRLHHDGDDDRFLRLALLTAVIVP